MKEYSERIKFCLVLSETKPIEQETEQGITGVPNWIIFII